MTDKIPDQIETICKNSVKEMIDELGLSETLVAQEHKWPEFKSKLESILSYSDYHYKLRLSKRWLASVRKFLLQIKDRERPR